ncbi:hypothetical protein DV515_00001673 [Chloebia gouldiae]|uniref:Uncharacterized protein n=1 Tax=Chloebia gouldiae TaxID=44316 RepID=A0A3L8SX85_CHLGU|nr:hypothetical protein DV515_00001673 [Chloebia gouldiae]
MAPQERRRCRARSGALGKQRRLWKQSSPGRAGRKSRPEGSSQKTPPFIPLIQSRNRGRGGRASLTAKIVRKLGMLLCETSKITPRCPGLHLDRVTTRCHSPAAGAELGFTPATAFPAPVREEHHTPPPPSIVFGKILADDFRDFEWTELEDGDGC